jgi:hypothetical protein
VCVCVVLRQSPGSNRRAHSGALHCSAARQQGFAVVSPTRYVQRFQSHHCAQCETRVAEANNLLFTPWPPLTLLQKETVFRSLHPKTA